MSLRQSRNSLFIFLALLVALSLTGEAFAQVYSYDRFGLSASNSAAVSTTTRGSRIYMRMILLCDTEDQMADVVSLWGTSSVSDSSKVRLALYTSSDGTGSPTYTTAQSFTRTSHGIIDATHGDIAGYVTIPSDVDATIHSVAVRAIGQYDDLDNGYTRMGSAKLSTSATLPGGTYNYNYIVLQAASSTPNLVYPSNGFQSGQDNNSMRFTFVLENTSATDTVTMDILSGSTVVQRIRYSSTLTGGTLYSGVYTYDGSLNGGLGGFSASAAADPDTTGETVPTYTQPDLSTRAALVSGNTYTVRLTTQEDGNASASTSFASFKYDSTVPTISLAYPSASYQSGRDDDTIRVRFTTNEVARANSLTMQIRSGSTVVQEVVFSGTAAATYGGMLAYDPTFPSEPFDAVPGSNTSGSTLHIIASQNTSITPADLVDGTTYTVRVFYTDIAGNTSANSDFAMVYDLSTSVPTLSSPASSSYLTLSSQTFTWNNSEPYSVLNLYIERTGGTADNNSPHVFTIASGNALLNATNPKSMTLDLSNLVSTANYTYTNTVTGEGAALVVGTSYKWYFKANHVVAGDPTLQQSAFRSFSVASSASPSVTLVYPSASEQGGRDDDSLHVRFTTTTAARANTITLQYRLGGSVAQQIVFSNTDAATYGGVLYYNSTLNPAPFSVVPSSNTSGATLYSINSQTVTTDLVDGTTYTVRVFYTDVLGNVSPNADFAMVYDVTSNAPTLSSPTSPTNLTLANQTFTWSNAEVYSGLQLYIERTSGTEDGNSPHIFTVAASNALLNTSNPKSVTLDLGHLAGTANYSYNKSDNTSLIGGTTYRWYFKAIDLANNPQVTSSNRQFSIASGTILNVSGTGLLTVVSHNQVDKPVYRITCATALGSATLTAAVGDFRASTAIAAEITNVKLWYSTEATFATGTSTLLSTKTYDGNYTTFNGFSRAFNTATAYLYVTISASSTAQHHRINTAFQTGSFTFSNSNDVVDGLPLAGFNTSLPVTLNKFSGASRNGSVSLAWTTESEWDNAGYEVIRRIAGSDAFETIATYNDVSDLRSKSDNGTSEIPLSYIYTDRNVQEGVSYEYRLRTVDLAGSPAELNMTVQVTVTTLPREFALRSNYPNPFNASTNLRFEVPFASKVTLKIYDISGREISTLLDKDVEAGSHVVMWQGKNEAGNTMASGTYFVRMTAGKFTSTQKIVMIK